MPFGGLRTAAADMPQTWCLKCGGMWMTDAISNVVLFAPLGFMMALCGVRFRNVALIAAAFSLFVECMQFVGLPPGRSPAIADVLSNTSGGIVGALLFGARRQLMPRVERAAERLALAWSVGAVALMALTSVALQAPGASGPRVVLRQSNFEYAPGFSWFAGIADSAVINDFRVSHRGTGPILIETSSAPLDIAMDVWLHGATPPQRFAPIVFLHEPGDTNSFATIGNRRGDAELAVRRRAWQWGLAMPAVHLTDIFAISAASHDQFLRLTARATSAVLMLRAEGEHVRAERIVALTPTLGWTMIQTLIRMDSPLEWLAHYGWLLALVGPTAWWAAQAGRHRARTLCVGALIIGLGGAAIAALFGVARIAPAEWFSMGLLYMVVAVGGTMLVQPIQRQWSTL